MDWVIEKIFIAPSGGVKMESMEEVEALAHCGLLGDRYCSKSGYWTGTDECEVTFIEAEALEEISSTTGIKVQNGEHRRNIVTRGVPLVTLVGGKFKAGEAVLEFDRPRPPCSYIQSITQQGMTQALYGRGGICTRVLESGLIRVQDKIVPL